MSDWGKRIVSAEIAREAIIEALYRNGALEDDQFKTGRFKSGDVDEVLAAVWFAMGEVSPGSRFGSGAERLEGTEPLTDEEVGRLLDGPMDAVWQQARAKLRARLAREDAPDGV